MAARRVLWAAAVFLFGMVIGVGALWLLQSGVLSGNQRYQSIVVNEITVGILDTKTGDLNLHDVLKNEVTVSAFRHPPLAAGANASVNDTAAFHIPPVGTTITKEQYRQLYGDDAPSGGN